MDSFIVDTATIHYITSVKILERAYSLRSRLPARASQWQAGSGEAGGSEGNKF